MDRHIPFVLVFLAAAIAFYTPLLRPGQSKSEVDSRRLAANVEQQLLSSTIQMSMVMVDNNSSGGGGSAVYAWRGLGTLVKYGRSQFILTHGHWPIASPQLIAVELRNSSGERLQLFDADAFLNLLHYHDRGTMIVQVSQELVGVKPAILGNISDVATGATVWLTAYDPGAISTVRVVRAHVEAVDLKAVPGRLRLRGPHTAGVALGDSGGGVWLDGKLVGNLWSIVAGKRAGLCWIWSACNDVTLSNQLFAATGPLWIRSGNRVLAGQNISLSVRK